MKSSDLPLRNRFLESVRYRVSGGSAEYKYQERRKRVANLQPLRHVELRRQFAHARFEHVDFRSRRNVVQSLANNPRDFTAFVLA